MQSRWFWINWTREYRFIWYALVGAFIVSFILLGFNYVQGANSVIHFDTIQEQKIIESTVHSFHIGPFELDIPADNYLILEYFNGSAMELNVFMLLTFIGILFFAVITILTVVSQLDRFWYFLGIGLFIVFIATLRLDALSIFGQRNQSITIGIVSLFVLLSFYFQALNKSVSFIWRFVAFGILAVISGIAIYFFSSVEYPMLHLAVTGYSIAMVLSILFILMVAHEIPAAFVYIVSQGNTKSLTHFTIISSIYILNVLITCLHELGVIEWHFIYINLYLLLSMSAILGLWGFRLRESLYANMFSFAPFGAYIFVALGTICFITIAQLLGTANDPALHIIRNIIIFSHVGYGIIFITYVLSNFILLLAQNLSVYRILYKPNRMPYITFRIGGLIMTLAFIFYSSWHQYIYNGIAGFYNNVGDLYEFMDKSAIAEAYYEQARNYGFENNHANYALGKLKASRLNFEGAHDSYEWANGRTPTAFSLINEGNIYLSEKDFFESINVSTKAIKRMPGSGEINNNLGYAFGKVHKLDSAFRYLNIARKYNYTNSVAEANFFAFAGLEYLPVKCDSVIKIFDTQATSTLSNALATATAQGQEFSVDVKPLAEKKLNLALATLLNNYIVRNVKSVDSTFLQQAYSIAADSLNSDYSEALKASLAMAYYHNGNVNRALQLLGEQVFYTQDYKGKYNYVMGLWALEQNNAKLAASYFKYAVDDEYKDGKLYYAIALTESGNKPEAIIAWDSVARNKSEAEQLIAMQMMKNLTFSFNDALALDDKDKYLFCRYLKLNDTLSFKKLIPTFQNNDYKAQALLDITQRFFGIGDLEKAIQYFNQIGGLKLTDKNLYESVQHMELLMLAERRELRNLAKQINKSVQFSQSRKLEKIYFTALINEAANDTINATKNYKILATYNPFFEQAIIAAADYFKKHSSNKMMAYTILVEAVQVNKGSIKLLNAYAKEAMRMGFPEYAVSALQQVDELLRERN